METTLKEELQKIGWSDTLIQHFIQDGTAAIRTVDVSDWRIDCPDIPQDFFDLPQKIDSTTFVL